MNGETKTRRNTMKKMLIAAVVALSIFAANVGYAGETKININTATQAELETLPGIGAKKAEAIVDFRGRHPFATADRLSWTPGITPAMVARIANLITVD
jgi:competence protein ComEA